MTRAEAVYGARVTVTDTTRARCNLPSDAKRWAQVLRGLHGRTGTVIARCRSPRSPNGEPTWMYARVRLDLRGRETDLIEVAVPLAGLELLPEPSEPREAVALELPRWT